MFFPKAIVLLTSSAAAFGVQPRWSNHTAAPAANITRYSTVTLSESPVTWTYVRAGSTWYATRFMQSTIAITECPGCSNKTVTVPGNNTVATKTGQVQITYNTLCPVAETVYGSNSSYVQTRTVTSAVVTHVPSTVVELKPDETGNGTKTAHVQVTYTTTCPVTETVHGPDGMSLVTRTTTSTVVAQIPSTALETVTAPGITHKETDVKYSTYTSLHPTTIIATVGGRERTFSYTTTRLIVTEVPQTFQATETNKDTEVTATEVAYLTKTHHLPVSQTTTVSQSGQTVIKTVTEQVDVYMPDEVATVTELGNAYTATVTEIVYVNHGGRIASTETIRAAQTTETVRSSNSIAEHSQPPPAFSTPATVPTAGTVQNRKVSLGAVIAAAGILLFA